MKININLATRPFADLGPILQRLRIAMAAFAVVSIGLGVGLHLLHAKAEVARARERGLDSQIAKINQERQGYQAMMRQPDNAQVLQQANNLNSLFDQKAFSWTLAMEDLETVLPGGVQVTTLEPVRDEKTGQITLKLRVVGPRDKGIELVQNLEHSHHFLHPAIVGESLESNGGPNTQLEPVSASNRVNFDLNAEYNSAAIGELPPPKKSSETEKTESGSAVAPIRRAAVPGAGPGLHRPTFTGVARPPSVSSRPAVAPLAPGAKPAAGVQPQAGPSRFQLPAQGQPATRPQVPRPQPGQNQPPSRPGGPQ